MRIPLVLLALACAGPVAAQEAPADPVAAAVARALPGVVAVRRDIHQHPELGERETRTAALVAKRLRELGLEVREGIAVTGVVGLLKGGKPGGLLAYRADMDGLPVREQTGLPYASRATDTWDGREVGVMHACGHDVHVAIALGLAEVLASPAVRAELPGSVLFIFQPAEEGVPEKGAHGALKMVQDGALGEPLPGAVLGLHVNPKLRLGTVSIQPKGIMAAVDRFRVTVRGKQAHGAYPHDGVDPVVAASHIVLALQSIASRNVNTHEQVILSVGKIAAGNRFNIIPAEAELLGTIRSHDVAVQRLVHRRLKEICAGVARGLGATAEVEIETLCPVLHNDPRLVASLRPVAERLLGSESLVYDPPHMGGEDFAFYAQKVPALFYFLGTTPAGVDDPPKVHTPFFAPDEGCLEVGLRTSTGLAMAWLRAHAP